MRCYLPRRDRRRTRGPRPDRAARRRQGQVPRRARQAARTRSSRDPGPDERPRLRRVPQGPVHPADGSRAGDRRGRRGHRRRRHRRRPRRGRAPQAGRRAHPHRRPGRRHRRHLVLEPLSGRDVRRRVVHLPADARGDGLRPDRAVRVGRGDPHPPGGDRRALRPHRRRPVPHRRAPGRVGRGRAPVAGAHRSGRRPHLSLVRPRRRDPQPHEAAGDHRHGAVRRPLVPHRPLGLRVHRRRPRAAADQPRRQGRRPRRHRCHRHPVPALAGGRGEAGLRLPADTVRHRRPRQPAHRARLRRRPRARAGTRTGWTTSRR